MHLNRSFKWLVTLGLSAVVAFSSGAALASAPARGERSAAVAPCLAMLRQELGTVIPRGWSGYQASDCSLTGGRSAGLAILDNPNNQWIGPETVSAALGQQASTFPTTGGSGDLTLGAASWRDAGASGRGPYASPQAAPALAIGRGPYASLQASTASVPTTGGSGDSISATGGWRDAGAGSR